MLINLSKSNRDDKRRLVWGHLYFASFLYVNSSSKTSSNVSNRLKIFSGFLYVSTSYFNEGVNTRINFLSLKNLLKFPYYFISLLSHIFLSLSASLSFIYTNSENIYPYLRQHPGEGQGAWLFPCYTQLRKNNIAWSYR